MDKVSVVNGVWLTWITSHPVVTLWTDLAPITGTLIISTSLQKENMAYWLTKLKIK